MSKWSMIAAWVLVAALATTVTWQIVSAADAQVSDRPPLQVAAPLPGPADSTTTTGSTPPTSTSVTSTTPTTTGSIVTAPTETAPAGTEAAWSSDTIATAGGTVVVSYRTGEVMLSSASPASGFAADIKKPGPPEVDVEFESESAKFRVRAEWSNGRLSVETEGDLD